MLEQFKEKAIRSYNWTSFSPERRGEQMIKDYSEELEADLKELESSPEVTAEAIADYKARYERLFSSYLHAKSGTFSAMITGPAKFNTRKHAKANRSEERHYEIFREWRERAKKAIVRKAQPVKTYVSEIDRYKSEVASLQKYHELMKEGNKRIKAANKTGEDLTAYLTETFKIAPHMIEWTMKFGFGLQNNNANIKKIEERIKELEAKEAKRNEEPEKSYKFKGGEVIMNYEADRIQIMFDNRPSREELEAWKAKGLNSFNWSNANKAWQRKITPNAIWSTKRMLMGLFVV